MITMLTGSVKFFNRTKGFGFIQPATGGKDVFFHKSGLLDTVNDGDRVEYETEEGKKGPVAVNIRKV